MSASLGIAIDAKRRAEDSVRYSELSLAMAAAGELSVTAQRAGRSLQPYLGLVGSRCRVPVAYSTGIKEINSRTLMWAQDDIVNPIILIAHWYQQPGVGTDTAVPGTTTYAASIEYPIGSTPVMAAFGGAATLISTSIDLYRSDVVPLTIPKGAPFLVRMWASNATGLAYGSYMSNKVEPTVSSSLPRSDAAAFTNGSIGNQTLNKDYAMSTGGGSTLFPAGIVAMTSRPTVAILGTSLASGSADRTGNSNVDWFVGVAERWIGGSYGMVNASQGGASTSTLIAAGAVYRRKFLEYVSEVLTDAGTNDFNSVGPGSVISNLAAAAAVFKQAVGPQKRVWISTVMPKTTSSDAWTTFAGQTPDATHNARRVDYNSLLRVGRLPGGVDGYFEIADQVEPYRDAGILNVSPTARVITDAAMTAGSNVLTSPNATFTVRDLGTGVYVPGAGASGAALTGFINGITSATEATITNEVGSATNAASTVSSAAVKIGALTGDGLHLYAPAYRAVAVALAKDALSLIGR